MTHAITQVCDASKIERISASDPVRNTSAGVRDHGQRHCCVGTDSGRRRYLYRAVDQFGQVIDVLLSPKRDKKAARRLFTRALAGATPPAEVSTDRARAYPRVLDELLPAAQHVTVRYANNRVEADHCRLKARLGPMRGLKRDRWMRIVATGHAFVQNLRRGHYALATEASPLDRVVAAFTELALAV